MTDATEFDRKHRWIPYVPLAVATVLVVAALLGHTSNAFAEDEPHCHHAEAMEAEDPLPGMSIYQLEGTWTTQAGESFELTSLRGQPVVTLMFFGTCQHACPILISDLQRLEALLTEETRAETRFVLVTFDPERDTPEALATLAEGHDVDTSRWTFLHGSDSQIRSYAAVLGVQYRAQADGQYTHTNLISALDVDGVIQEQVEGLNQPMEALAARVEELAQQ